MNDQYYIFILTCNVEGNEFDSYCFFQIFSSKYFWSAFISSSFHQGFIVSSWLRKRLRTFLHKFRYCAYVLQKWICNEGTKILSHIFDFTQRITHMSSLTTPIAGRGAPWVKKSGKLPIWENLVITWPYTRPPARPFDRPSAPQAYQCLLSHFLATLGAQGT